VHRSQLLNAPYNPRTIDKRAREKLKKNLKEVGLVEAPSWNVTTGNLLSGHQRVAILDLLVGHGNYLLDVCQVELEPKVEKTQNAFLNNPMAQGDWDVTALAGLLKTEDFDHVAAGWDRLDLEVWFTDDELAGMFAPDEAAKEVFADLARVGGIKQPNAAPPTPAPAHEATPTDADNSDGDVGAVDDRDGADLRDGDDGGDGGGLPASAAPPVERRSDAVKSYMATRNEANDTELYSIVVFESRKHREVFMAAMGQDPNTRNVDGARVFSRLGIDPDAEWAKQFGPSALQAAS